MKQSEKIIIPTDKYMLHENDAWERSLDFLLMENAYLKTRLSEAVDAVVDKTLLDEAEQYHTFFLKNDETFKNILSQVKMQKMLLNKMKLSTNDLNDLNFTKNQSAIRLEMENTEEEFQQLKRQFNHFIANA